MMQAANTFQRKLFEKRMEEERRLRYPSFKQGIARVLNKQFNIEINEAMRLAFIPEVDQRILKDVAWAQHMGVEYWAETIMEQYLEPVK